MHKILLYLILSLCIPPHLSGQDIRTIAGATQPGYSGDGGLAIDAKLNNPESVRVDSQGNIYISDNFNNVVRKINTSGIITTIAGNGVHGYSGDGGPATNAELKQTDDIAIDGLGNIYIAVAEGGTIRKISKEGIISTFAGTGVWGYSGEGIPATDAKLFDPCGLVFDRAGNLYFSFGSGYRICKINTSGIITTIAGTGIAGSTGDNGPATAAKIGVVGYLGISKDGDIYMPEYGFHGVSARIRRISRDGIITTVAGGGANYSTYYSGPATNAGFYTPLGVTFDYQGNYYISDNNLYMIRKVDTFGNMSTIAGTGVCGSGGDGGPATAAEFCEYVNCTGVDLAGNLYIADLSYNRIRRITYNATSVNNVATALLSSTITPNPAKDYFTISSALCLKSVIVLNTLGRQVIDVHDIGAASVTINTTDLPPGMYIITIADEVGNEERKKVVVSR